MAVGGSIDTGRVLNTIDGGINWTPKKSGTNNLLTRVHFVNSNSGWAVGYNGTIITTRTPVSVDISPSQPIEYELSQNFPNPFNPLTTIKYQISEISFVTLIVYDVLGSEITTLVNEEKPAGIYDFVFDAANLSTGIYFYRLQSGSFVETKKMVLMK